MAKASGKDVLDREHAEKMLYSGRGLPGGGQLEIRIGNFSRASRSGYSQCGAPGQIFQFGKLARRMDPSSAEKNEELAADFEREERKVTAHEFYLRAADFYRRALVYLPETDSRMLPTYKKLQATFDKAWSLVSPPFEQVHILYEGHRARCPFLSGTRQIGKPSSGCLQLRRSRWNLLRGEDGGAGQYCAPRHVFHRCGRTGTRRNPRRESSMPRRIQDGWPRAVIDYLVTRPDVDPNRIGLHGSSMGGYSGPRCATVEKRIKAVAVWSGAYNLIDDIFDYYPPIQDRLRWLMGAKDLKEAREKIKEFTLEGRADRIACPLLVGYSHDDRVMDPPRCPQTLRESRQFAAARNARWRRSRPKAFRPTEPILPTG